MRQPISFIYRNLVFRDGWHDAWAVYRLFPRSYAGLTAAGKKELMFQIASLAYGLEADFTLLRVARPWNVEGYLQAVRTTVDPRHVRQSEFDRHLERQRLALGRRTSHTPEIYLSVRLAGTGGNGGALSESPLLSSLRQLVGWGDARAISRRRLQAILDEETKTALRIGDYVDAERAASHELQWLIRRAFCRGLGDPVIDERFLPQALVIEPPSGEDGDDEPAAADVRYRPLEVDSRLLRIEAEQGESFQAVLCLGALPEVVTFPGRRAELLFAPLEALDFAVDAAFSARLVPNAEAVRLVRRRIVDADNVYEEESHGDHGPSAATLDRPRQARELEEYLTAGDHPPLLRSTISLAVGAATREELEDRVERLRREYGAVKLHRPLGDQVALFISHLPGQSAALADYDDYLTVEQFGSMVPTATHAVGSEEGPYVGHTLSGARQPVLFDATEACRTSRAPATLLAGTLGSGKTLCMQLIMYQAFLTGSTICDIDPKGDHALEALPGVAEHMEVIELSADERYRGMLDPLRIGPEDTREDLACNFLLSVLPDPVPPTWQTEIRLAVQAVAAARERCCGAVIEALERGSEDARAAGRALGVHARSGLARLGLAEPGAGILEAGSKPVTSIRISNLTLPLAGTPRAELLEDERVGRAILHLLAVYALRLTSHDPTRHAVLGFDEAWVLLSDSAGRALIDRISRLGRARNVTPLLATQVLGDVDELEGLIGAAFCFGVETEREARDALRLLHLDEDDDGLKQRLVGFRRGRCFLRDYEGHVSPVQIDLLDPDLLAALDTTPVRGGEESGAGRPPDVLVDVHI
jgi:hypothetical protein